MKAEKSLEFALKMRDLYENDILKNIDKFDDKNIDYMRKNWKELKGISPLYFDICNFINDCEIEVAYNTVKASRKGNEKTRTTAAKRMLKKQSSSVNPKGFLRADGDNVVITNGYILFIGKEIIGISEETENTDFNWKRAIPKDCENHFDFKLSDIKAKYKIAKVENGKDKAKIRDSENGHLTLVINEKEIYFDSSLLIDLCEMIDGENFTISITNGYTALVTTQENENYGVICAYKKF